MSVSRTREGVQRDQLCYITYHLLTLFKISRGIRFVWHSREVNRCSEEKGSEGLDCGEQQLWCWWFRPGCSAKNQADQKDDIYILSISLQFFCLLFFMPGSQFTLIWLDIIICRRECYFWKAVPFWRAWSGAYSTSMSFLWLLTLLPSLSSVPICFLSHLHVGKLSRAT